MPHHTKALLILLACSLSGYLSCPVARSATPAGGADAFSQGVQAFASGRYGQALPLFEKAAQLMPGNAEVHYYLGNTYFCSKKFDLARQEYETALSLHPTPSLSTNLQVALRSVQFVPAATGKALPSTSAAVSQAAAKASDEHLSLMQQSVKNMQAQKLREKRKDQIERDNMKKSWQFNVATEEARIRAKFKEKIAPLEDEWMTGYTMLYGSPFVRKPSGAVVRERPTSLGGKLRLVGETKQDQDSVGAGTGGSSSSSTSSGVAAVGGYAPVITTSPVGGFGIADPPPAHTVSGGKGGSGGGFNPEVVKARMRSLEQEMQRLKWEEEDAIADIKWRADRHDEDYKAQEEKKDSLLDESQSNIEKQIEKADGKHFGMKPIGTNLYSRYYGEIHPTKAIPEAHGATARILPSEHAPIPPNYSTGQDNALKPPEQSVSGSVVEKTAK